MAPDPRAHSQELSIASARQQLFELLRSLPTVQFGELLFSLNPPRGLIPSRQAAQGERVEALLDWAEGPYGCGLRAVLSVLATYASHLVDPLSALAKRNYWLVPYSRNPFFTGRELLLQNLRENLTQNSMVAISQVQAISGLGGIGKTQTAVEYVYRYRDEYGAVFWVRADTALELSNGFVEIAQSLNLPQKDASDQDEVVQAVKTWLRQNSNWLLILDNADKPSLVQPFKPESSSGHILITSRAQEFQNLGVIVPLEMEPMQPEEALTFLLRRTGRESLASKTSKKEIDEVNAATQLAQELGCLPLALEQASAYIVAKKARFQDYLTRYKKHNLSSLEASAPKLGDYSNSVASVWNLNFQQVEKMSPASADLLRLSAFLCPDAIPFEMLTKGGGCLGSNLAKVLADANEDPLLVNDVLEPLFTYSLVWVDPANQTYSIHRLVQEVLRNEISLSSSSEIWIDRVILAANELLPEYEDSEDEYQDRYQNWPALKRLSNHGQALALICQSFKYESLAAAYLFDEIGAYLGEKGQYSLAESLLEQSLKIRKILLKGEHIDLAKSLNNLAVIYDDQGRYIEAEPLYKDSLRIRRKLLGESHSNVATSLNNLALLYKNQGRFSEAEDLYKKVLEIDKGLLGDTHPGVATTLDNLASVFANQGRYDEAESLHKKALKIYRKLLGNAHPDVATSLNNLAVLYIRQGNYGQAEAALTDTVALRRKILGNEHPHLAISLNNLARCHREQQNYYQASILCQEALDIAQNSLPENHELKGRFLNNFGTIQAAQGWVKSAKSTYRQALKILESTLGKEHPWTVKCCEDLAVLDD